MSDIWEEVWDVLNEHLRQVAVALMSNDPDVSWRSGHHDNEFFPFSAYAIYERGKETDNYVVLSINFRFEDKGLTYSSDIGFDDGQVLADGPTGSIGVLDGLASARGEIQAVATEVARFIDASESMLREAISAS